MRFQFKNGNRQVSVGGQEFHADSNGVISIPDALAPMLRATLGNDIMSAAPPPTVATSGGTPGEGGGVLRLHIYL